MALHQLPVAGNMRRVVTVLLGQAAPAFAEWRAMSLAEEDRCRHDGSLPLCLRCAVIRHPPY
jgi:hypothetical protein